MFCVGILLHGPPGCAKTSLARAAAGAAGVAFFSLSPADVYASSYLGEAEAVVRRAFTLARSAAPCIIFFDELDSILGGENGMHRSGGGKSAEARVLSTFLNEMDGVDVSVDDGVLVLGATNRPSTLDAALLRPGRFDKVIYVPPPDFEARKSILDIYCHNWQCASLDITEEKETELIDTNYLASDEISGLMTGAEIVGACREAAIQLLREGIGKTIVPAMKQGLLERSLREVKPLLSNPDILEEYIEFEQHKL
mmetsp:Transcript_31501/g.72466  ORF Transcript_31501/g.72466 Transcript_31501/m.72466 type:complete len:254 (+) Transcript_31501:150-911(+)|eukprot:CAMPEP_0116828604 /NCGR_PEP_ID=MMETSP0418-20121206/3742_1 /TAXON_ID=1158023 /ORGANISM="Astrosyne radiata, Strain 13vi08-1A" /LENGTH=253 /DNA_ID=CAMNT_0004457499 /DNA_START=132 /DNA_END=896 /DNA_ORIENTATION=+